HMVLASNIFNALGGEPQIDSPQLIPPYPTHLPGTVQGELKVGLVLFSIDLVSSVFMRIEETDVPLEFSTAEGLLQRPTTIGDFYRSIGDKVRELAEDTFSRAPRHQIGPDRLESAVIVTDADSACKTIDIIVEQGEGTRTSPGEVIGTDFAHYYRFAE